MAETAEGTNIVNRSEIEKTTGCYENDICVMNMAKETQATDEIIAYEEFLTEPSLLKIIWIKIKQIKKGNIQMKSKIVLTLCISMLILSTAACQNKKDTVDVASTEPITTISFATETATEPEERSFLSESRFHEMAAAFYNLSDTDAGELYQKITDSKILEKENTCLTGAVINDYDQNGKNDMIVCLYEDTEDSDSYADGCLYLFMNDDETPYPIYDDFCCYSFGSIFGDFGADIDGDGNTEIVFCVQGTGCGGAGDSQKFMVKYKDETIERMEIPTDFTDTDSDYDVGLFVDVERDNENNVYKISCPYLNDTILMEIAEDDEDWGGGANCRGYHTLALLEQDGRQYLAGYEYLYAGSIADGIGNAVFLFDWDEDGKIYVSDWYVEDFEDNRYASNGICGLPKADSGDVSKNDTGVTNLFEETQTGAEAAAYEEFLTGKRTAKIANNCYTDISYIGGTITDSAAREEKDGISLTQLYERISDEIVEDRGGGSIGRMEYALIDCGGDGKKQLALRAYGVNIYAPDDDSDLTMVFDYQDGAVSMIYAVDSWARSENELYDNGYVFGGGSGGASCHYVWEGLIGADGIYHKVYDCHMETGCGLADMSSCWEVWDSSDNEGFPAEFCEYEMDGETLYSYYILDDVTDEERNIVTDYIKDNEARMGIRFLTSDEAWARVEKNRTALGITEGMDAEENKIAWKTHSITK